MFRAKDLSFGYQPFILLFEKLSFALEPNRAILLTGENGCGKSTLLKLLAGILTPAAGSLTASTKDNLPLGKHIFYHAQNAMDNLLGVNAEDELALWQMAMDRDISTATLTKLYRLFGFETLKAKPFHTLSTGERRAASLLPMPLLQERFWLLDEPFNGLDSSRSKILTELVHKKLAHNRGMMLISHQIAEWMPHFDELWQLEGGNLIRKAL